MSLFRRNPPHSELEVERCPRCREPVPEEAAMCTMCGLPLEPVRDTAEDPPDE
jgi:predicted amidophosphoribosyltransferase